MRRPAPDELKRAIQRTDTRKSATELVRLRRKVEGSRIKWRTAQARDRFRELREPAMTATKERERELSTLMNDRRESLDSLLSKANGKPEKEPPEADAEDLGPCASRSTTKRWAGFHVKRALLVTKGEPPTLTTRSFDYSHMGYREYDPDNQFFIIEINEPEKWRICVEGRALRKLYNYLHQHRLEWIEAASGRSEMAIPNGQPVMLRITIQRIEDADGRRRPNRSLPGSTSAQPTPAGSEPPRARQTPRCLSRSAGTTSSRTLSVGRSWRTPSRTRSPASPAARSRAC